MLNKQVMHTALIALATYAVIAVMQKKVMQVPVVGAYLPGAAPATA